MTDRKPDNLVALHYQETGSYVVDASPLESNPLDKWALNKILGQKSRILELEAALKEARGNMRDWGAYVPEYFQEKHGLERDLAAIDEVLGDS